MMEHLITVKSRVITMQKGQYAVQNNKGVDYVKLQLDGDFDDLDAITVTMRNSEIEECSTVAYEGEPVEIPAALLATPGTLTFTVTGYVGDSKRVVTKAMPKGDGVLVVASGDIGNAPDVPEAEPDFWGQAFALLKDAAENEKARQEAEAARVEAEAKRSQDYANSVSLLNKLLGIDAEEIDQEEKEHIAETMYEMVNASVKIARVAPLVISRAGLNDADALEHAEIFPDWESGRAYKEGDIVMWDGTLYRLGKPVTATDEPGTEGTEETYKPIDGTEPQYPVWEQPFGAHDAYQKGDVVTDPEDGKAYQSKVDVNVWGPPSQYADYWKLKP